MHTRHGVTPRDRHCWYRSGTCRITALLRAPQRAQWMVGEPLPPKAALTAVPGELCAELPARAAGHEYVEIDGDVMLVLVQPRRRGRRHSQPALTERALAAACGRGCPAHSAVQSSGWSLPSWTCSPRLFKGGKRAGSPLLRTGPGVRHQHAAAVQVSALVDVTRRTRAPIDDACEFAVTLGHSGYLNLRTQQQSALSRRL
jgi:hypothetical protein